MNSKQQNLLIVTKVATRLILTNLLSFSVLSLIFFGSIALSVYAYNKSNFLMYPVVIILCYYYGCLLTELDVDAKPPPFGMILNKEDVPTLFGIMSEIAHEISVPMPSKILLTMTPDHEIRNVTSWKTAQLKKEVYISLSLPSLMYCSLETFRGQWIYVLSSYHSSSGMVYRAASHSLSNVRIILSKQDRNSGRRFYQKIIYRFYSSYAKYMQSDLEKLREICIKISTDTGYQKVGFKSIQALIVDRKLLTSYMESSLWLPFRELASSNPTLPLDATQYMYQMFRERSDDDSFREILEILCTMNEDQHIGSSVLNHLRYVRNLEPAKSISNPSLVDRLVAAGVPREDAELLGEYEIENPPEKCAAELLFGEMYSVICRRIEKKWLNHSGTWWKDLYIQNQKSKSVIHSLLKLAEVRDLTLTEQIILANNYNTIGDKITALEKYYDILQSLPDNTVALEKAGRLALSVHDERGEELLWRCMLSEPDLIPSLGSLLVRHYNQAGNKAKALEIAEYIDQNKNLSVNLSNTRLSSPTNGYLNAYICPRKYDEELIENINRLVPEIISIYLYEREFSEYDGARCITLILMVKRNNRRTANAILQKFLSDAVFPFRCVIFTRTKLSNNDMKLISPFFKIWSKV